MNLEREYREKRVFITGITGFKGSWLAYLLHKLGAEVCGLGLEQKELDTAFYQLKVSEFAKVYFEDIQYELTQECKNDIKRADYVFHFAAQAIVSEGIHNPYFTFNTNTMGTVQLLELLKNTRIPVTLMSVASDRVYAPNNDGKAHKETDNLGGLYDPYSVSKVFQNSLLDCYRNMPGVSSNLKLINARTSNVIGGGDRGQARLITSVEDAHRNGTVLELRNPFFTRQYIFVLDCLCGYLYLASKGTQNEYNIGSGKGTIVSVKDFVEACKAHYINLEYTNTGQQFCFEGSALSVNTDRFHNEFPEIKKHIAETIQEVIDRTLGYNMSDNKLEYASNLVNEAISVYSI